MAHANGARFEIRFVQDFLLNYVHDLLRPHVRSFAQQRLLAIFQRAAYWLHTLSKLDHPSDFQAAISSARALLEITVDVTLLAADPAEYHMGRLYQWERSAKLKHVNAIVQLRNKFKLTIDPKHEKWADDNRELIKSNRQHLWQTDEHPDHWSGKGSLQDAAAEADRLRGKGSKLERYYVRRYRPLCWATHGSGVLAVEEFGTETFPQLLGEALHDAANFGMLIAERSLVYLQAMTPQVEDVFERARRWRAAIRKVGQAIQLGELGLDPKGVNGVSLIDPFEHDDDPDPDDDHELPRARQRLLVLLARRMGKERKRAVWA